MFQTIPLYIHAGVITPTEPSGQTSLDVRKTAAFPELWAGRLPQLVVSRPAQRSLAFRPACSPSHLRDPLHQRLRRIRYLLRRSDCYRVERLVPGWESHPLRIAGFSRRTTTLDHISGRTPTRHTGFSCRVHERFLSLALAGQSVASEEGLVNWQAGPCGAAGPGGGGRRRWGQSRETRTVLKRAGDRIRHPPIPY